ncbi:MAG: recombinase family protein [Oscillospiraceae bacterium]
MFSNNLALRTSNTPCSSSAKHGGAYCRYSTDNQSENSIAYQLNAIQKYCQEHNISIVNIYTDEATSGTNTNRDGLQHMLYDAQHGLIDAVIIYDQSRLSRNVVDWFEIRETLRKQNVSIYSCTETLENENNSGVSFLSEGVRALFNHQFVLDTRNKVIDGQTAKAKEGVFLGGTPPLGYDIVDGKYVINPSEAEAVKFIFDSYAKGKGYGYIVDRLKNMGVKSKRNADIGHNALYAILRNERYIGVYSWMKKKEKYLQKWAGGKENPNAIRIEGIIPAIIDIEVWDMVKKRTETQKRNSANTAKNEYLLSGLITCGECGGSFVGFTTTSGKRYKTRYYTCANKRRLHNCKSDNINADDLETLVVGQVERDILNNIIIERVANDIIDVYKQNCGDSSAIKKEISECEKGIDNLLSAISKGLDPELAMQKVDQLKLKKQTLELQLTDFIQVMPTLESVITVLKEDISKLKNDRKSNLKLLLNKYITNITVTNDSIIINCLGDLIPKGIKKITSLEKSNDVTTTGCGGRI